MHSSLHESNYNGYIPRPSDSPYFTKHGFDEHTNQLLLTFHITTASTDCRKLTILFRGASSNYDELFAWLIISSYVFTAFSILIRLHSELLLHIKYEKVTAGKISL